MQQTSLSAYYERVKPSLGERQFAVYRLIKASERDWSNSEIGRALGWSINRVTPRVKELRDLGILTLSGKRRCAITGLTVCAWKVRPVITQEKLF